MAKNLSASILYILLVLLLGGIFIGGVIVAPIVFFAYCFYFLKSPDPLSISDVNTIKSCVEDYPEIEEYIAEWLTQGPLDKRHYSFILSDWMKRRANTERESASKEPDKITQMLRSMGDGRVGRLADEKAAFKQEEGLSHNTAKAKNLKSKQPRL